MIVCAARQSGEVLQLHHVSNHLKFNDKTILDKFRALVLQIFYA